MIESSFPYEIKVIESKLNERLKKDFTGILSGFVQIGPEKWLLPYHYKYQANNFYNFKARSDDTWVVTFPRSGTTWTQEMAWLIANDLNFQKAQEIPLVDRFPFFEFNLFFCEQTKEKYLKIYKDDLEKKQFVHNLNKPGNELLDNISSPRFIKTHLPFSLLPPNLLDVGCKVIYVARNPKDVAVSFYHLNRLIKTQGYVGNFETFWDYFENDLVAWAPYWSHIKEGWERRHRNNLLFLFYEDILKNLKATITKISKFYGKDFTEEEINKLAEYLNIVNFRNNKSVNYSQMAEIGLLKENEQGFVRNGKSGEWQEEYTPELRERAEKWIKSNLEKTDLRFSVL